jgi:hypothetical protein
MRWLHNSPETGSAIMVAVFVVILGSVVALYDQTWYWLAIAGTLGAMLVGVAFMLGWAHHRSPASRPPWMCPNCGYDRRGLAAGSPCPECGR